MYVNRKRKILIKKKKKIKNKIKKKRLKQCYC